MKPERVHILASCRKTELVQATMMVFRTVRIGFPNAELIVWLNEMPLEAKLLTVGAARQVKATILDAGIQARLRHDLWIENLVKTEKGPFWILDTDVAFFGSCEGWFEDGIFAGRLIPTFYDPWTRTVHIERLHTALMWLNPAMIREALLKWSTRFPESWMAPSVEFFKQTYWPRAGQDPLFHDSTAGLWQSVGGTPFTAEQNAQFEHLHCGTYSDLIGPLLGDGFQKMHEEAWIDPRIIRGLQQVQNAFYEKHAVKG